jgi:DNA-binding transcriptional LysR family regulator
MELDDLRIFVATVDAGSFTAAADKLMLSKQYVSRRMIALETALGVRLLIRNTRKLAVTESGQDFYTRAHRILAEVSDAEEAMSTRRNELRGVLRLSAPMSFGISYLSPLLAEFLVAHPALRLQTELSDKRIDLIGGGFDLALRIGKLGDSTLIARRLGHLRMAACCSPAYRDGCGVPFVPADLSRHACLLYGDDERHGWEFVVDGKAQVFDVNGPLLSNNGELLRDAALAGLGIAYQPHFIVGPALARGELVQVLGAFMPPPLRLNAVYPQHRQGSVAIRVLLDFLEARCRETLDI